MITWFFNNTKVGPRIAIVAHADAAAQWTEEDVQKYQNCNVILQLLNQFAQRWLHDIWCTVEIRYLFAEFINECNTSCSICAFGIPLNQSQDFIQSCEIFGISRDPIAIIVGGVLLCNVDIHGKLSKYIRASQMQIIIGCGLLASSFGGLKR